MKCWGISEKPGKVTVSGQIHWSGFYLIKYIEGTYDVDGVVWDQVNRYKPSLQVYDQVNGLKDKVTFQT